MWEKFSIFKFLVFGSLPEDGKDDYWVDISADDCGDVDGSDTGDGDGCEEGNDVNVDIDVDGDDDVDVDCDDDNCDEGKRLLCVICPSHCEEDELVSSD